MQLPLTNADQFCESPDESHESMILAPSLSGLFGDIHITRVMNMRLIASTESEIATFSDQFLGLKTIFEQAEFPYWILVQEQTVLGLIVAAKEPRELLQPVSILYPSISISS